MIKQRSHGPTVPPPPAPERGGADAQRGEALKSDPVAEQIGRELRKLFDTVVAEPVPEKFRQLIDDLKGERRRS